MKRFLSLALCAAVLLSLLPAARAADAGSAAKALTGTEYHAIYQVSAAHRVFVTAGSDDLAADAGERLYSFDGKLLLKAKRIALGEDLLTVSTADGQGLYTYDLREAVPCVYGAVYPAGTRYAVAVSAEKQDRRERWYGARRLYDLSTGAVVSELPAGYGTDAVTLPDGTAVTPREIQRYFPAAAAYHTQRAWFDEDKTPKAAGDFTLERGSDGTTTIRRGDRSIRVDFAADEVDAPWEENDYLAAAGDPSTRRTALYTARGRKIAESRDSSIVLLAGGAYYALQPLDTRQPTSVYTIDGVLVGTYDQIDAFTGISTQMRCDREDVMIVEKGGRYGLTQLQKSEPQPHAWAAEEASAAVSDGLVSEEMQLWWRDSCTRAECCSILMRVIERRTGKNGNALGTKPLPSFSDCAAEDVLTAASLGIVKGYAGGAFHPDEFVTRQEAACMLARTAAFLGISAAEAAPSFADDDAFAPWAAEAILTVAGIRSQRSRKAVMGGIGGSRFAPAGSYTVEQAVASALRLIESEAAPDEKISG